jgi:hypothetical protein
VEWRVIHAHDVLEIVVGLQRAQVALWLDGGWGVDALLGEQARVHDDLDIIFSLSDGDAAILALSRLGVAVAADERPTRFVARDGGDRRIDCHTVTFDGEGGGVQQIPKWRLVAVSGARLIRVRRRRRQGGVVRQPRGAAPLPPRLSARRH